MVRVKLWVSSRCLLSTYNRIVSKSVLFGNFTIMRSVEHARLHLNMYVSLHLSSFAALMHVARTLYINISIMAPLSMIGTQLQIGVLVPLHCFNCIS